jgi:hypothetical protein
MHDIVSYIALAMGAAWASGINLYAAILVLGLLGTSGNMSLPDSLQVLQHPVVIGSAGFMYCIEFFADKVQGLDSAWDTLHTFVRIPAGAVLAAYAIGDVDPAVMISAALIGGSLTAGTHLTKASARLLVNSSPEPFSNIGISLAEDTLAIGGLWVALNYPSFFLCGLVIFLFLMIWVLPILWRGIKGIYSRLIVIFRPEGLARLP